MPFVLRIIVQALLDGSPEDLQAEARALSTKIQESIPSPSDVNMMSLGLDEQCPACHAHVSLQDITTATCPNGHTWGESLSFPPRGESRSETWVIGSPVLRDILHPIDTHGPHVHGMQPQGVPASSRGRKRRRTIAQLAATIYTQLGRRRSSARRPTLLLLWQQLCLPRVNNFYARKCSHTNVTQAHYP